MASPPRVFLDTSALLAGLASPTGASNVILSLGEAGLITLLICEQVLVEAERNLYAKLPVALHAYRRFLSVCPHVLVAMPTPEQVREAAAIIHPKDAPILAAAMLAQVDYLVTLNRKHFLDDPAVAHKSGLVMGSPGDFLAWFHTRLTAASEI